MRLARRRGGGPGSVATTMARTNGEAAHVRWGALAAGAPSIAMAASVVAAAWDRRGWLRTAADAVGSKTRWRGEAGARWRNGGGAGTCVRAAAGRVGAAADRRRRAGGGVRVERETATCQRHDMNPSCAPPPPPSHTLAGGPGHRAAATPPPDERPSAVSHSRTPPHRRAPPANTPPPPHTRDGRLASGGRSPPRPPL